MFKRGCNGCGEFWYIGNDSTCKCPDETLKREWVGLTEDESDDIYNAHHNTYGECITSAYDLVLDVEAKLKEKNNG
jgi:hypothetical protein